ncbi:hypothetical protein T10_8847 [Trichinella papuae]|uniref:Uncharacterized protein n=1 Tax=Trichinella papuae TaxID=268474 RepID=A0A0V1M2R2_9BILA|nr:hypothetical protein T10_8847 [Trichinella papuae]
MSTFCSGLSFADPTLLSMLVVLSRPTMMRPSLSLRCPRYRNVSLAPTEGIRTCLPAESVMVNRSSWLVNIFFVFGELQIDSVLHFAGLRVIQEFLMKLLVTFSVSSSSPDLFRSLRPHTRIFSSNASSPVVLRILVRVFGFVPKSVEGAGSVSPTA